MNAIARKSLVLAGLSLVVGMMASTGLQASSRADVLERIKPIGEVRMEGAPAPAVAEPAPAAETSAAAAPAAPASGGASSGEGVYKQACFACHMTGAANAPKLGDKVAWAPRIAKGMDALLQSAINGVPGTAMAPRGTCAACSDDDLKSAVEYMVSNSQ
jgi:cytochrome c5